MLSRFIQADLHCSIKTLALASLVLTGSGTGLGAGLACAGAAIGGAATGLGAFVAKTACSGVGVSLSFTNSIIPAPPRLESSAVMTIALMPKVRIVAVIVVGVLSTTGTISGSALLSIAVLSCSSRRESNWS